jgi:hypothetical protein
MAGRSCERGESVYTGYGWSHCPRKSLTVLVRPRTGVLAMTTAAKKATAHGANSTDAVLHLQEITDQIHALLMDRADALMGCTENSPEETELAALTDVIEAYERLRWL